MGTTILTSNANTDSSSTSIYPGADGQSCISSDQAQSLHNEVTVNGNDVNLQMPETNTSTLVGGSGMVSSRGSCYRVQDSSAPQSQGTLCVQQSNACSSSSDSDSQASFGENRQPS